MTESHVSEIAIADLLANSGIDATADEVGAIALAVARIQDASRLLGAHRFDDTAERYFRLLGQNVPENGA